MSKIIKFPRSELVDIPANEVLEAAIDNMSSVVLIGFDKNKDLYIASTTTDIPELLFLHRCLGVHLKEVMRIPCYGLDVRDQWDCNECLLEGIGQYIESLEPSL